MTKICRADHRDYTLVYVDQSDLGFWARLFFKRFRTIEYINPEGAKTVIPGFKEFSNREDKLVASFEKAVDSEYDYRQPTELDLYIEQVQKEKRS